MTTEMTRRGFVGAAAAASFAPATGLSATSAHDELALLDATETSRLVRSGQLSAREATEAAIRRIEAVDPRLNSVIRKRFDQALEEASKVSTAAPFAGVPTLIKDVVIQGEPFYNGSKVYADVDFRADHTDVFVDRIRAMGMPILGVTNIPEFTSAPTTESRLHGPCRNPWDTTRSVGGSSGGAGAAVAALLVPAAQSSDGGGSSRIPASANGAFTIKTGRGRTPLGPANADWMDITSSKSFITRSVRDFAGLIDALGPPAPSETLMAPPKARPYVKELDQAPGALRIGLCKQLPGNLAPLDLEAVKAVEQSALLLASLGHHVEEAAPETYKSAESFAIIGAYWPFKVAMRTTSAERALGRRVTAADVEPGTYNSIEYVRNHTMMDFAGTLQQIASFIQRSLAWWRTYDLLLTPTTGSPPPGLGVLGDIGTEAGRAASLRWGGLALFANITGQPAASVPLYWTAGGLPIGTHLIADIGREDLLVQVASQLERARPWAARTPPVSARRIA
jgi:amidase